MYEQNKTLGSRIKRGLGIAAIVYTAMGSCYMLGQDVTGHRSADLHECKVQPTTLDKKLFEAMGVDPVAHCKFNQERE
jgi:hypothetical protein